MHISYDFVVPSAEEYVKALKKIKKSISDSQKTMLERHFKTLKHTISFAALAEAVGSDDHLAVIDDYNALGRLLGDTLNMGYLESVANPGEPFYCSSIGGGNPYRAENESYQLVMHRELVEALFKVKWFKE